MQSVQCAVRGLAASNTTLLFFSIISLLNLNMLFKIRLRNFRHCCLLLIRHCAFLSLFQLPGFFRQLYCRNCRAYLNYTIRYIRIYTRVLVHYVLGASSLGRNRPGLQVFPTGINGLMRPLHSSGRAFRPEGRVWRVGCTS